MLQCSNNVTGAELWPRVLTPPDSGRIPAWPQKEIWRGDIDAIWCYGIVLLFYLDPIWCFLAIRGHDELIRRSGCTNHASWLDDRGHPWNILKPFPVRLPVLQAIHAWTFEDNENFLRRNLECIHIAAAPGKGNCTSSPEIQQDSMAPEPLRQSSTPSWTPWEFWGAAVLTMQSDASQCNAAVRRKRNPSKSVPFSQGFSPFVCRCGAEGCNGCNAGFKQSSRPGLIS